MKKVLGLGVAVAGALAALLATEAGRRHGRRLVARADGLRHRLLHLREQPKPQPNDATLAAKVQSEVLGDAALPAGDVNVNAENGIVILRGQVESEQLIDELVARVRKVHGVQGVESLLHLPGAEAPMHGAHTA
jgi:osmotically-inducible protein OsmY